LSDVSHVGLQLYFSPGHLPPPPLLYDFIGLICWLWEKKRKREGNALYGGYLPSGCCAAAVKTSNIIHAEANFSLDSAG
jgi:hypothetical protein